MLSNSAVNRQRERERESEFTLREGKSRTCAGSCFVTSFNDVLAVEKNAKVRAKGKRKRNTRRRERGEAGCSVAFCQDEICLMSGRKHDAVTQTQAGK